MSEQAQQTPITAATSAGADPQARPVWLVEHPTHRYNEDVKALARQHGLQVVDAAVAGAAEIASAVSDAPKLTLRGKTDVETEVEAKAGNKKPAAR